MNIQELKTAEDVAGAVVVVKNLLIGNLITHERAILALWNIVNEVGDSIHYRRGSSAEVERLLAEIGPSTQ